MRYFFGSFVMSSDDGTMYGNVKMQSINFPSQDLIKKLAAMRIGCMEEDIGILNIFEFKSKEDFDSFEE